ncbi:hypothetical protein F5Y15DRAFT_366696 [Xylariaceae sp. FL0016]|nr:hypothetical protein F5Y15DRAFT_366696 [Xylariaceae sp. FL0016]
MGLLRKLGIYLALAVAILLFLPAQLQYHLVSSTSTVNQLSPADPIFSSVIYEKYFGGRTWAKIESFGVGVAIPITALPAELSLDEEAFAKEVMKHLWNARMNTQFKGRPWDSPPQVGAVSSSDAIRADVVETGPLHMALTITTAPTEFIGGLEVIQVRFDEVLEAAMVLVKYVWHNDIELPRWWYQYTAIWMQLTGRRIWLLEMVDKVTQGLTQTQDVENRKDSHADPITQKEL